MVSKKRDRYIHKLHFIPTKNVAKSKEKTEKNKNITRKHLENTK